MLYGEMLTEIRKQAEEDALAGVDLPDLSIATVVSGERVTPPMLYELRGISTTAHAKAALVGVGD